MRAKKNPNADLNKFRLIFLQLGLIISLGITYFGIEWSFQEGSDQLNEKLKLNMIVDEPPPVTEMKPQTVPPPPPPPIPEVIEVIDDQLDVEETHIESTETSLDDPMEKVIKVEAIVEEKMEEKIEEVPFILIADVPVYPGCENEADNASKKKCMSAMIEKLVKEEFNSNLGAELGLEGINRVIVVFTIDHKGYVTNIKVRGPHKALEEEAIRVVSLIPHMTPGHQRNRPVNVTYTLPIVFEVRPGI
ncbi:energy transducer TonB [Gramella sp. KN1008]|uniref:energy transducer TonB n=1 Tax=Gramella sp. KN1008 TaxID=2529298 RepID=UPI00103AB422|nr:energy transducer TonB [Gramella sp. KN1008]TBW30034.1 energy transducer TonB [Gramella sp. KN1008]